MFAMLACAASTCASRLRERGAVVAIVDPRDHLAGLDMLVVGDRNRRDVARDFRRNGELARGDEGVVGALEMTGVVPVEVAATRDRREQQRPERQRQRTSGRAFAWRVSLPGRGMSGLRRRRGSFARLPRNIP